MDWGHRKEPNIPTSTMNPSNCYAYPSNFLLYIPRHSFDQYVDMSVLVIAGWQSKRQKGSTTVRTDQEDSRVALLNIHCIYFPAFFTHDPYFFSSLVLLSISHLTGGPGSSVGTATGYGLDGPEIKFRWG
jgi:hypothetical protein